MKKNKDISNRQRYVEERIREAERILHRLPEERVQGYFNLWPAIKYDAVELLNQERKIKFPPLPEEISDMEEVIFIWLKWLEPVERKIVWLRAERTPWKLICGHFGVGRTKGWEMYKCALGKIAKRI